MMKPGVEMIESFLRKADKMFPEPLSEKQDLSAFARKLYEKATICWIVENGEIVSMVAGYTDHLENGMAYVSILATLEQARRKGYAEQLMKQFMGICREKAIKAVHLYAVPSNMAAMKLYARLGFEKWILTDESRPKDAHLIFYFSRE